MRIAQVVCTDAFAGVERYVLTLATGLARRGHEVAVCGGAASAMRGVLEAASVEWAGGATTLGAAAWIRRTRPFDVVHVHMTKAEAAAVLGGTGSTPLVSTRHFAARRGSSVAARLAGRYLDRRIDAQLAISEYVAARIEGRSVVIPPGVDPVEPIRPASARSRTVLMAQRLEQEKDSEVGLRAWALSGLADRGWTLLIAGDGHERRQLERLVTVLGVDASCRFLGYRADVADLQRDAAIFLATAPAEPFGLSVVEAMAAATPVVATGSGGHAETVGRVEGAAVYAPGDVAAAARLLEALASDQPGRADYGARCRAHQVQHLSAAGQVEATLAVYGRLA